MWQSFEGLNLDVQSFGDQGHKDQFGIFFEDLVIDIAFFGFIVGIFLHKYCIFG